jgi:hypothetical protein
MSFSRRRDRIGVTEIGLKSEQEEGVGTLGTGVMILVFQLLGMNVIIEH